MITKILTLVWLLIGTYTEGTSSDGVYLYSFDTETAAFERLGLVQTGNPSFVIAPSDGRTAYCVNEFKDGRQALSAISLSGGDLRLINTVSIPKSTVDGEDPCHLLCTGDALISSNYSGGSLTAFALNGNGSISEMTQYFLGEKKSHIHCAVLSPDGKYIFVTDLGTDRILRFNRASGIHPLGEADIAWKNWAPGRLGPRHLTFSPDGRFAYLLCELSDKLIVFSYDEGRLSPIQVLTAYPGKGHGSADIHLSPDGRFLYTSHRLKGDGISIFSVNPSDGKVTPSGFQPTGKHPRNFTITPDGRYLLCACRDESRIEIYAIDPSTGALTPTARHIRVPSPSCVQVVPAADF